MIGEGGSGRHSLTRLAAYINNIKIFENRGVDSLGIFREKLKEIFEEIIFKKKKYILLFSDT